MNYKMIVAYDGTRYNGWQKQKNTKDTIQGKLERVLKEITGEEVEIHGAGRTDAGVHALAQVANFSLEIPYDAQALYGHLNKKLPEDIAVISVEEAPERFHARLNATGKEYCYRMWLSEDSPVFERKYVFHHPDEMNVDTMMATAAHLMGTHDFALFNDNKKFKKSTERTIYSIDFIVKEGLLEITFTGDGFMYHMIRRIMGMLIHAGETEVVIEDAFARSDWPKEWPMAPARGLILKKVLY